MKFFKKITSWTLISKVARTVSYLVRYIKDYNLVSDTLYSDSFKLVLKRYLNLNVKKDWIGRLYGVLNPNIDIDGNFNFNNTIIEMDDDHTNSNEYVKTYIYKQMGLVADLFKINKLYDYISCDIEPLDDFDNFLIVFDLPSRVDLMDIVKKLLLQILIYGIITCIIIFFIF